MWPTRQAVSTVNQKFHAKSSTKRVANISTAWLNTLLCLHLRPINIVVSYELRPAEAGRVLILGRASCLDAFSAYLNRTWLPSDAVSTTTGTPEVRSFGSSRHQIFCHQKDRLYLHRQLLLVRRWRFIKAVIFDFKVKGPLSFPIKRKKSLRGQT